MSAASPDDGVFEAAPSRWRIALLMLLSLGFVAMGLFIAGVIGSIGEDAVPWIGWLCAILFGAMTLLFIPRLMASGTELRVDARGIWWKRWSDVTIPWDAIDTVSVRTMRRNRFLCLQLYDPAAYRSQRALGRLAATNRALGFGDVPINITGTDRSFNELVSAVERYVPRGPGGAV